MLGVLLFLGIYVVAFFFLIFVMICGANRLFRDTWVGRLQTWITVSAPKKLKTCCMRLCPHCCCWKSEEECLGTGGTCRFGIAIFFFVIYFIFATIYFCIVYPHIPHLYSNVSFHKNLSLFLLPVPWVIFIYFQFADPGVITAENVERYLKLFPYDNIIYSPHTCRTLGIPVVPRSRYCKFSFRRIAKYDHYCPWVIAPVGYRTHRFFLLFLLSIVNVSAYYAFGSIRLLVVMGTRVWQQIGPGGSRPMPGGPLEAAMNLVLILISREPFAVVDGLVLTAIAVTMLGFLLQQMIHVSRNVTQIEDEKYAEAKKELGHPIKNFYSKGFWGNWKEELFPPSLPPASSPSPSNPTGDKKIKKH